MRARQTAMGRIWAAFFPYMRKPMPRVPESMESRRLVVSMGAGPWVPALGPVGIIGGVEGGLAKGRREFRGEVNLFNALWGFRRAVRCVRSATRVRDEERAWVHARVTSRM